MCLAGIPLAQAGMYRWVDGNGRVQYGDTLPANYQKSGAAELNSQGQVIKRTTSAAEREAEAVARVEQAKIKRAADVQARLDRALTSTYTTEAEIDLARDRALAHHKLAIHGAETRAKAVAANIRELQERADKITQTKRAVPSNLRLQLAQSQKESLELKHTILNNEEALIKVREKYETDKQRFRLLVAKPLQDSALHQ